MRKLSKKIVKTDKMVQLYGGEGGTHNTNWYCSKGSDSYCTNYVCH